MHTLFGTQGSGSAAIEIALKRCELEYTLVEASSWQEGEGRVALEQLNPLMQVPTLQLPDGAVLTESAAILAYLGLEYPASGLLSAKPTERAEQLRALVYIAANCYSAIGILDYPERWLPNGEDEELDALVDGARKRLHLDWDTFADIFGGGTYWHPRRPGAPEIFACVVTQWSSTRKHLQESRPSFYASLLEIDAHPMVAPVLEAHWPKGK